MSIRKCAIIRTINILEKGEIKMANPKTNVMRLLEQAKIPYEMTTYEVKDGKITTYTYNSLNQL